MAKKVKSRRVFCVVGKTHGGFAVVKACFTQQRHWARNAMFDPLR